MALQRLRSLSHNNGISPRLKLLTPMARGITCTCSFLVAERISARQLIRVHISANTYVRTYVKSRLRISLVTLKLPGVTLRNAISHAQISWSHLVHTRGAKNSTHARTTVSACPCVERSRKSDRTYIYPIG